MITGDDALALLPTKLSPSRAGDYAKCPKSFYFKTIERMPSPPTLATTVGSVAHLVCEKVFDYPASERTPELAAKLVPGAWEEMLTPGERGSESYQAMVDNDPSAAAAIIEGATLMVTNWFNMERVSNFEPYAREMTLNGVVESKEFLGILDRMDCYEGTIDGERRKIWAITDYKTGRKPREQYEDEAFRAMELYALLVKLEHGIDVDWLRMVYLKDGTKDGVIWRRIKPVVATRAGERMLAIRNGIERSAAAGEWPTQVGPLCKSCSFRDACPEGQAETIRRSK